MDFLQNPHYPHFSDGKIPDGFAVLPLSLFIALANQQPFAMPAMPMATIAKPAWNDSLYDRAMARSNN